MPGGEHKSLFAGAVLILLLYAALSCWPALKALLNPQGGKAPAPTASSAPPPPLAQVPQATSPGSAQAGSSPAQPQAAPPAKVLSQALADAQAISAADSSRPPVEVRWQVLSHNVELFQWPKGPGLLPPALSFAPLTVCSGSSLQVLDQQGNWAKVRSRGKNEGWVCLDDLALKD